MLFAPTSLPNALTFLGYLGDSTLVLGMVYRQEAKYFFSCFPAAQKLTL